jgi:hypothetical protein
MILASSPPKRNSTHLTVSTYYLPLHPFRPTTTTPNNRYGPDMVVSLVAGDHHRTTSGQLLQGICTYRQRALVAAFPGSISNLRLIGDSFRGI